MLSASKILVPALVSLIFSGIATALPDDRNQPVEIQANQAERDAKSGVTTYTGNVDVRQGSIHIAADSVVLDTRNNELSQIRATGKPASYSQQLSGPNDIVEAKASTIHFDVAKDVITLQGNGSIKQQGSSIRGEYIEYDIKSERVKAKAAEAGSRDNSKRITVVIPPSAKKPTQQEGQNNTSSKDKP